MPHIETTSDELVNLNSIIRFEASDKLGYRRGWFLDEEGDLRVAEFDSVVVDLASQPVIPNTTAYQYADHFEDESGTLRVRPRLILGWRLSDYGTPEPVTGESRFHSEEVFELVGGHPLIAPNGEVHIGETVFDDVADYEAYLARQRKWQDEREKRREQRERAERARAEFDGLPS